MFEILKATTLSSAVNGIVAVIIVSAIFFGLKRLGNKKVRLDEHEERLGGWIKKQSKVG